jgi:glycosyltransferase involved in cell wall biosynthesis
MGVDTDLFCPRDRRDARRQVGLDQDAVVLLWLGRFSEGDKADLLPLLRAYHHVVRRHPRLPLLLALCGNPISQAGHLAEYALHLGLRDRVAILDGSALPGHLVHAAADVFVSPADNIQEAFGLAPVEAMACGVPQIVADWDGYRDTVDHGVTGLRVPTLWAPCDGDLDGYAAATGWEADHLALAQSVAIDVAGLADALEQLATQPALRARMGEASRQRALAHYAWPKVLAQYHDLWRELSGQARRTSVPEPPPPTPRRATARASPPIPPGG